MLDARGGDQSKKDGTDHFGRYDSGREAGFSDRQIKQAVRVANVPEEDFERQVESESPPSVTKLEEARAPRLSPAQRRLQLPGTHDTQCPGLFGIFLLQEPKRRYSMSLRFMVALVAAAALAGCVQPTGSNDQDGGGANSGNTPPEVTLSAPTTVENGAAVTISPTVTDPDDTTHAFEWMLDGAHAGYGPEFVFSRSPQAETTYTVTVLVSDGEAEATASCSVTVAAPAWQPEPLHVYTFPAESVELSEDLIVEQWEFTEDTYHDMLRRVEATVEVHNRDNPDNQLQVVGGGLP